MPWDLEKRREYSRLRKAKLSASRRAQGLCTKCGIAAVPGRRMCSDCLVRNAALTLKLRNRRLSRWSCIDCGKPSRLGRQTCIDCGARRSTKSLKYFKPKGSDIEMLRRITLTYQSKLRALMWEEFARSVQTDD